MILVRASQHLSAILACLAVFVLFGCGSEADPVSTPASVDVVPTVALPAITLAEDDSICAPGLRIELYVKGQAVKGALVEDALGCDADKAAPRFYEFRRSLYRCGTLTHYASLPDGSTLRLIDRSASQCMDSHHKPQLEVMEIHPDGKTIHVSGRLTP